MKKVSGQQSVTGCQNTWKFHMHFKSFLTFRRDMKFRKGALVACISRKGKVILPRGDDRIEVGDTAVVITSLKGVSDIDDIFEK